MLFRSAEDPLLRDLAARLARRKLLKTIDLPDDPGLPARLAPQLESAAREVFGAHGNFYWAIDRSVSLGYDHRPGEEIFVVGHPRHGTIDLGELVADLPMERKMSQVRLICAPELVGKMAAIVQDA